MTLEEILVYTRLALGVVLLFTSLVTVLVSVMLNEDFLFNGLFVAFWCAVSGGAMVVIAVTGGTPEKFEVVNLSALLLFSGWSLLLLRVCRRLRAAVKVGQ